MHRIAAVFRLAARQTRLTVCSVDIFFDCYSKRAEKRTVPALIARGECLLERLCAFVFRKSPSLDNARDISESDPQGAADPQPRGLVPVSQAQVDAQTKRDLAPYFQKSQQLGPPTGSDKVKRQVLARVNGWRERYDEWRLRSNTSLEQLDLTPDLAEDIGSRRWFRGLATMLALGAFALSFWPSLSSLAAPAPMPQSDAIRDEFRSQAIMPLGLGAESGRRMGPTAAVTPLENVPERPQIAVVATLGAGDSFVSTLRRAGVSAVDIDRVGGLISSAIPLEEIAPGTQMDIVLGRRPGEGMERPLTTLKFRARFDLELAIDRQGADEATGQGGALALARNVIRVDDTPLRVRGEVGSSLYRSMRAAGVPASAVQDYLRTVGGHLDMNRDIRAIDQFDIIIAYRRAATGERQAGQLLYAGIERRGEPRVQLMRWGEDGEFYEASGVGEQRRGLVRPVPGPVSSGYGMRRHPILGYRRMHAGLDYRASRGTPIVAVTDGRVVSAGRAGGCGITVKLDHGGKLETRYCHMSRMAVRRGQSVQRGQVIGYVGSTGLSTGPHLHYEMYRNGRSINPASVDYVSRAVLEGAELRDFRRQLSELREVAPGAALEDLEPQAARVEGPVREVEKINTAEQIG
ncbi:MAG: M23 family metallopeptidase [Erythrobacter sp.]|nr:M23 family metallopeptidase [Erythrobacter sp.]